MLIATIRDHSTSGRGDSGALMAHVRMRQPRPAPRPGGAGTQRRAGADSRSTMRNSASCSDGAGSASGSSALMRRRRVATAVSGDPAAPGVDGRERRDRVLGLVEVVEADDRDVARHTDAGLLEHAHRAEREGVVQAEDGVERRVAVDDVAHRLGAARAVPRLGVADEGGVVLEARGLDGLAIALEPEPGRADDLALVRADEGDAASPRRDQVLGRGAGGLDVLHADVVVLGVEDPLAEEHERVGHTQRCGIRLLDAERAEDEPVGHGEARAAQQLELAGGVASGLLDEHDDAGGLGRRDHRAGEFAEVGEAEVGHGQRDGAGAAGAKASRGQVRLVAELGDRLFDTALRRRADVRIVVDDVRHRLDRDARDSRHVVQCHGHSSSSLRQLYNVVVTRRHTPRQSFEPA